MLLPIVALTFLTAFCIFIAIYLVLMERQSSPKTELKRRLQRMARGGARDMPEELRSAITRESNRADQFLARLPLTRGLDKKLHHAGIGVTSSRFVAATASVGLLFAAAVVLRGGPVLIAVLAASSAGLLASLFLRFKTERRINKFTELFPDALSIVARSLRAGHSFTTAIQLVGQEVPSPVGPLFKTAYDQQQLGLRMTDALIRMNERIDSLDLRLFTTVVSINADVGGNLSEVLDKLAMTIRDRLKIRRQVQVYTAQGRMSGYVLGALPVVAFVIFNVLNPEYEMAIVKDPMGIYLLVSAAFLQLMGLMIIRKIIRIRI